MHALQWRMHVFDFRGSPELSRLVVHYCNLQKATWARQQGHPLEMLYRPLSARWDPTAADCSFIRYIYYRL